MQTATNNIVKVFSYLELMRRHNLPSEWNRVTRTHYLGEAYRNADYTEVGKGMLRWAEDYVYTLNPETNRYEPHTWLDWQVSEVLRVMIPDPSDPMRRRHKHLTYVWCWPRRYGKTLIAALINVHRAFNHDNQKIIISANSERQAESTAFDLCRNAVLHSPKLLAAVGRNNVTDEYISFPNGSTIIAVPRSIPSMYGMGIHIGQTTELCVARDDDHYQVLASSTGDVHGFMQVDSNFGSTANKVYQLVDRGLRGEDESIAVSLISFATLDEALAHNLSPYITAQWLRARQMDMTSGEFKRNHLNQPSEGAEQMFTEKQVDACIVKWPRPRHNAALQELINKRYNYVMFGGGYDGALAFSKNRDRSIFAYVMKGHLKEEVLRAEYADHVQTLMSQGPDNDDIENRVRAYAEPFEYVVLLTQEIPNADEEFTKRLIREADRTLGPPSNIELEVYQAAGIHQWCGQNNYTSELISAGQAVQTAMFNLFYSVVVSRRFKIFSDMWLLPAEMKLFQADEIKKQFGLQKQTAVIAETDHAIDVLRDPAKPEKVMIKDDAVYATAHAIYGLRAAQPVVEDVATVYIG